MFNKTRGYEFRFNHYIHDHKRWDKRESKWPERKQTPPIKIKLKGKVYCGDVVKVILRNKKILEKKFNARKKVVPYAQLYAYKKRIKKTKEEQLAYQREYQREYQAKKRERELWNKKQREYALKRKKKIIKEELWQRNKR